MSESTDPEPSAAVSAAGAAKALEHPVAPTHQPTAWSRQGRVSLQTSHSLSAPLGHITPEHTEGEIVSLAGEQIEAKPDFVIPDSVLHARPAQRLPEDSVRRSPIAGLIVEVAATAGQAVRKGETVLIVEAMKMQNHVGPEVDGVVKVIHVSRGDTVKPGQVLFEIT